MPRMPDSDSPMFRVNGQEYRADNVLGVKQLTESTVQVTYPRGSIVLENTTASMVLKAIERAKQNRR